VQNLVGIKDSEGLVSASSPPQSRSSSAQGSYSTSATTFDDTEDVGADSTAAGKKGPRPKEAKGNVLVSVRVRPDNGAHEGSRADGEWMVDGRRSLIAFKGKESYDYFYGKVPLNCLY
jgi:centromeric protein E